MISVPPGVRVLLAARPVDFRKGSHGLAALAAEALGEDPFSGAVIVFRAKRADRIKLILWDGSGLVLVCKQLSHGTFRWPPVVDGVMTLSGGGVRGAVRRPRLDACASDKTDSHTDRSRVESRRDARCSHSSW